jgi:hypothetical protein
MSRDPFKRTANKQGLADAFHPRYPGPPVRYPFSNVITDNAATAQFKTAFRRAIYKTSIIPLLTDLTNGITDCVACSVPVDTTGSCHVLV